MIAKAILPWFGGASAVWVTCMLFFQAALLGGYLYAHGLARYTAPAARVRLHVVLLAVSLLLLPVLPSSEWKPAGNENPILRIIALLTATLGLPYLLLASASPLLQFEYARRFQSEFPYRWFALSNLASMLGLLTYPTLVEPSLGTRGQAWLWSAVYVVYAAAVAWAMLGSRSRTDVAAPVSEVDGRVEWSWMLLPACASTVLLAGTQYLSENIAPVPLLWVLPLSAYLLSFILCFDARGWYRRSWFVRLHIAAVLVMAWFVDRQDLRFEILPASLIVTVGVFLVSMYCHGELVERRPAPALLTKFYLMIAAGGALGGLLVAVAAPWLLPLPVEFAISLVLTMVLTAVLEFRRERLLRLVTLAGIAVVCWIGVRHANGLAADSVMLTRSFYGTLRVTRELTGQPVAKSLTLEHGVIKHGYQLAEEALRRRPTAYFGVGSGAHAAIERTRRSGQRVGIIGLGTGTLAAYGLKGDLYRFYEINPQVLDVSQRYFTFMNDSPAAVEAVLGDGRLSLEREPAQRYDLLVVDAFSSDSIPAHLLTREALRVYLKHLRPDGVIALHISNKVLNLEPVVAELAADARLAARLHGTGDDPLLYRLGSTWALMAREEETLRDLGRPIRRRAGLAVWTDDYSNVWSIIHK
jgi:hypothetical protein